MLVTVESTQAVTTLTLNRPEKRNALNSSLLKELLQALKNISPDQRIVVLQGAGPAFCTGLDLKEATEESSALVAEVLQAIYLLPQVTVAAVHGYALAGGAGLLTACDFVIAAPHTKIGFPEVKRGLIPAMVLTLLKRQLSGRAIRELLLLGELIDAKKALELGLVNEVTNIEEGLNRLLPLVLENGPQAIAHIKDLMLKLDPVSLEKEFEQTLSSHQEVRRGVESQEGIQAFLEKRKPKWVK